MTLALSAVAALAALLILPGWSFSFDVVPKVVLVLAGAAVVLVFWREAPKRFAILAGAQAAIFMLATLFSTNPKLSLLGSTWRKDGLLAEIAILVLALALASNLASDRTRLRLWLRITVLASAPAALYGILQYFGIDPILPAEGYHFGEGELAIVRPPSTLGHAAYFATYLLYAAFAGVALSILESSRVWKAAALATSALACLAIALSGTRAALAGLVVGAMWVGVRERLSWKWVAGSAAVLALMVGLYASPAGERLRARAHWSADDPLGGARLLLWRDSVRMAAQRPLAGYGPETFAIEFPRYQSIELARAYPDFYHESPHNMFLDALVSKGILGLLALAALTALGLRTARGPIGGSFVAILVSQQFISFTVPTELYFYLCLALLVTDSARQGRVPIRLLPCALAAGLAGFAGYLAIGDVWLGTARRALDRGDLQTMATNINRARRWNASADIYFSRRLLAAGFWNSALDAAEHAPATADDRLNAWVNLAAFQATHNDASAVEHSLRQAIAAAPNWFKPHWLLAQVLALEGRKTEAEAEAQAAVERNGGKTPEVTQVREQLRRR